MVESGRPKLASQLWLSRLTERVAQKRSRLDFGDMQSPDSVEDRLLREVFRQMIDSPFALLSQGLSTSGLDRKQRGLRSKAFRRFGGGPGLVKFALGEALRPDRSELTDALIDSAAQALLDPGARHEDVLRTLGAAYFEAVCDDPCLTLQTFAWLGAREEPGLRASFVLLYTSLGGRVAGGLDIFLAAWGRKPQSGFTAIEIATALTSLIEGLAMRTAVDPDAVTARLAAESALTLVLGFTEVDPDSGVNAQLAR